MSAEMLRYLRNPGEPTPRSQSRPLPERLRMVCAAIAELTESAGRAPTIREVGGRCGWRSSSTAHNNIELAYRAGLVDWDASFTRTLRLTRSGYRLVGATSRTLEDVVADVRRCAAQGEAPSRLSRLYAEALTMLLHRLAPTEQALLGRLLHAHEGERPC